MPKSSSFSCISVAWLDQTSCVCVCLVCVQVAVELPVKMALALRRSLLPLYIISKVLCIHAFSIHPLQKSWVGGALAATGACAYTLFHLASAQMSMSPITNNANVVALIIDSYNRYASLSCLTVIVTMTIAMQTTIVDALRILEGVDASFDANLNITMDNYEWAR